MYKYPLNIPPWNVITLKEKNVYDFKGELEILFKKHVLLTNSGRNALFLYLQNSYWEKKEVIVPAIICSSIVDSIKKAGLKPFIVDVGDDINISIDEIKNVLETKKDIGGIIMAHMNGLPADIDSILKLAKRYDVKVIDDAAQALGGKYKKKLLGGFGDCGILSFGPGKMIVGGGGALITKYRTDVELEEDKSQFVSLYLNYYKKKYTFPLGFIKKFFMIKKSIPPKKMNERDANRNLWQLNHLRFIIKRRQENTRIVLKDEFNPDCIYSKLVVPKKWIPKERNFQIDILNPPLGSKNDCPNAWKLWQNYRVIPNEPWIDIKGMEEINEQLQRNN